VFDCHDLWEVLRQQVAEGRSATSVCRWAATMSTTPGATDAGVNVVQVGYNRLDHTAERHMRAENRSDARTKPPGMAQQQTANPAAGCPQLVARRCG
jgi:hypothetical protein